MVDLGMVLTLISIVAPCVTIFVALRNVQKQNAGEIKSNAEQAVKFQVQTENSFARIDTRFETIQMLLTREGTDRVEQQTTLAAAVKDHGDALAELRSCMVRVQESTKSAHHRIDDHTRDGHGGTRTWQE